VLFQMKGANSMFTRRKFLVQVASSLALTLGAGRLAKAAVGGWAQQEGGSQDLQTDLVWLDFTNLQQDIGSLAYATTTAANFPLVPSPDPLDPYINAYDDWRLPTLAEMTTACAHGLAQNCPLQGAPGVKSLWWSSTTAGNGGKGYAMDLRTGISDTVLIYTKSGKTITYRSFLFMMFVREAT
jgi:hypothetical protein